MMELALIRPVLLYGSETWVLTKRERKVFRTICGLKIENGVCRRSHKQDIDKKFDSPIAQKKAKKLCSDLSFNPAYIDEISTLLT
jgi:hypothetical protein